ncbi:MAG: hypothetical protein GPOALKHO_000088 [Sodalis sp.]|nr:MAG: hypothetical protein GPOALKHO_000088 [Sodalis sp.]
MACGGHLVAIRRVIVLSKLIAFFILSVRILEIRAPAVVIYPPKCCAGVKSCSTCASISSTCNATSLTASQHISVSPPSTVSSAASVTS